MVEPTCLRASRTQLLGLCLSSDVSSMECTASASKPKLPLALSIDVQVVSTVRRQNLLAPSFLLLLLFPLPLGTIFAITLRPHSRATGTSTEAYADPPTASDMSSPAPATTSSSSPPLTYTPEPNGRPSTVTEDSGEINEASPPFPDEGEESEVRLSRSDRSPQLSLWKQRADAGDEVMQATPGSITEDPSSAPEAPASFPSYESTSPDPLVPTASWPTPVIPPSFDTEGNRNYRFDALVRDLLGGDDLLYSEASSGDGLDYDEEVERAEQEDDGREEPEPPSSLVRATGEEERDDDGEGDTSDDGGEGER